VTNELDKLADWADAATSEKIADLRARLEDPDPDVAEQARADAVLLGASLALMRRNRAMAVRTEEKRKSGQLRAEWLAIVKHYRKVQREREVKRPSELDVAVSMGIGERTLVEKHKALGIKSWHDVHALIEALP
jgi:hypothetical protein